MDINITLEEFEAEVAKQDAAWEAYGKPIVDLLFGLDPNHSLLQDD